MPWNSIRPYVSYFAYGERGYRPAEGWPTTRVWITHFERDVLRLRTRPLWQSARLHPDFRVWAERPSLVFKVSEMAGAKGSEPFALVYQFWTTEQEGIVVNQTGELVMAGSTHTVAVTDNEIQLHGLPKHAFSAIVDRRNGRDPETYRSLSVMPIQDPVADDVVSSDLEGLV